jgi:hypothetical protein
MQQQDPFGVFRHRARCAKHSKGQKERDYREAKSAQRLYSEERMLIQEVAPGVTKWKLSAMADKAAKTMADLPLPHARQSRPLEREARKSAGRSRRLFSLCISAGVESIGLWSHS